MNLGYTTRHVVQFGIYLKNKFSSASFWCWCKLDLSVFFANSLSISSMLITSSTLLWLFSPILMTVVICSDFFAEYNSESGDSNLDVVQWCFVIGWFCVLPDDCGRSLYVPLTSWKLQHGYTTNYNIFLTFTTIHY